MSTEGQRQHARDNLVNAVNEYSEAFFNENDREYNERAVAGVMAFLQTNYYREPYMPVDGYMVDEPKKWWEFWK